MKLFCWFFLFWIWHLEADVLDMAHWTRLLLVRELLLTCSLALIVNSIVRVRLAQSRSRLVCGKTRGHWLAVSIRRLGNRFVSQLLHILEQGCSRAHWWEVALAMILVIISFSNRSLVPQHLVTPAASAPVLIFVISCRCLWITYSPVILHVVLRAAGSGWSRLLLPDLLSVVRKPLFVVLLMVLHTLLLLIMCVYDVRACVNK